MDKKNNQPEKKTRTCLGYFIFDFQRRQRRLYVPNRFDAVMTSRGRFLFQADTKTARELYDKLINDDGLFSEAINSGLVKVVTLDGDFIDEIESVRQDDKKLAIGYARDLFHDAWKDVINQKDIVALEYTQNCMDVGYQDGYEDGFNDSEEGLEPQVMGVDEDDDDFEDEIDDEEMDEDEE